MTTNELDRAVRDAGTRASSTCAATSTAAAERRSTSAYAEATGPATARWSSTSPGPTYINTTGIALIVGPAGPGRGAASSSRACGLTEHYREIFAITRLADFMTIPDAEDRAISGAEGEHTCLRQRRPWTSARSPRPRA